MSVSIPLYLWHIKVTQRSSSNYRWEEKQMRELLELLYLQFIFHCLELPSSLSLSLSSPRLLRPVLRAPKNRTNFTIYWREAISQNGASPRYHQRHRHHRYRHHHRHHHYHYLSTFYFSPFLYPLVPFACMTVSTPSSLSSPSSFLSFSPGQQQQQRFTRQRKCETRGLPSVIYDGEKGGSAITGPISLSQIVVLSKSSMLLKKMM